MNREYGPPAMRAVSTECSGAAAVRVQVGPDELTLGCRQRVSCASANLDHVSLRLPVVVCNHYFGERERGEGQMRGVGTAIKASHALAPLALEHVRLDLILVAEPQRHADVSREDRVPCVVAQTAAADEGSDNGSGYSR